MRKLRNLMILLALSFSISAVAQVKQLWTQQIKDGVRWQKVTSMGNYVVGTSKGISGINPDNGQIIWSNASFGPVSVEQVDQVGSSPLISVNLENQVYMINPYTGEIKFNSKKAGVHEARDQIVLYQSNGILISGRDAENKDVLLMSSLNSGEVVWSIREDYGRLVTANELSPDELLIVTVFYNYKVNPQTGKIIWKNDVSDANKQMEKLGALGGLMKQAAGNMAQTMDFNVMFYRHPTQPVFYVASEQEGKAATTGFSSSTSTGGPSYHTTYSAFNLNDGSSVWKKPLDVSGKMGPLYFHDKGLVVLPDDGLNTKVNLYDYNTQAGMWGKKGQGVKVKGGIYSYMKVESGLILVSQNSSGKNFISYFDLTTGVLTFDKPVSVDGEVVYSEKTPKGLLYITTDEANILTITDGSLVLKSAIRTSPALTAHKDNLLYAFDMKSGKVVTLDKSSGVVAPLSGEIKFEGKELPTSVQLRSSGVLVSSSQNLVLIGFDGTTVYQKYYEAPREPGIMRALYYAQSVRAAYIGAASYSASAAFQSAGQQAKDKDPGTAALAEGIGKAYNELGNAASDFAKRSFQQASARFKATQESDNYTVVLTKPDKNITLMKVNKDTGKTDGVMDLGKDNTPDYVMDGVTGVVFYNTGSNNIIAYKL